MDHRSLPTGKKKKDQKSLERSGNRPGTSPESREPSRGTRSANHKPDRNEYGKRHSRRRQDETVKERERHPARIDEEDRKKEDRSVRHSNGIYLKIVHRGPVHSMGLFSASS